MFCHIVPKTYLEKWKIVDKKDSIFVFDNDNISSNGKIRDLNNLTRTGFGSTNYYFLKLEDCNYRDFDDLFNDLFSKINENYILKLNKLTISSAAQFRMAYLNHKDKLKLYRKDNNAEVKLNRIISIIYETWKDKQSKYIERFFSKEIENDWNKVVSNIEDINSGNKMLLEENKKRLILFIVTLISRNHKKHNDLLKLTKSEHNNKSLLIIFLFNFIRLYNKEIEDNNDNYIYERYKNLVNSKLNITLLSTNLFFITTDNPIVEYKGGFLLPITPKICIVIKNSFINKIKSTRISNEDTKEINNLLISNSIQNFVFFEENISDLI